LWSIRRIVANYAQLWVLNRGKERGEGGEGSGKGEGEGETGDCKGRGGKGE